MKITLLLILLSAPFLIFSEKSVVAGFLNDNYTGTTANGENGNYIGADDFLTFSLFVKGKSDRLSISQYYNVVTSRKEGYRYDILDTTLSYDFFLDNFTIKPSISLMGKSDLGGDNVQNGIHKFKDLPTVDLAYSDSEIAASFGVRGDYSFDSFTSSLEFQFPTGIKPPFTRISLDYSIDIKPLKIDLLTGYKQYLSSRSEYSEFVRSGAIFGFQGCVTLPRRYSINGGAFFFPAKNLENDPLYKKIDHSFSPQFWIAFGYNGNAFSILDIVNY